MERMTRFIRELSEWQWLEQQELTGWDITRAYYNVPGDYSEVEPYPEGLNLQRYPSEYGTTYFFKMKLEVPAAWQSSPFGMVFESGGEGLLRVNGRSYQGLDRNHTYVTIDPRLMGISLELEIELFDPVPEPVDPLNQQAVIQPPITSIRSLLVRPNEAARSLMYTATVIRDSAVLLHEGDFRQVRLLECLHVAMDAFVNLSEQDIHEGMALSQIEERLVQQVRSIGGNAEGLEHMIGQSHIDIAWLWPVRETVRKTSRTFSTVDALMNEYPGYKYAQSQPQLYAFLKEHDPELYSRVKQRIAEGRWELVGGMWVEPDLNIPSGESLMRQMLYGQRFYQEEFGLTSRIEWLPDTFGYCASLPQILKHGNMDYFMTTKLGWNDTNEFPYSLFHWVGIDGTAILSYHNHGVNENTLPKDIHDHWQAYREKTAHPEQMLLYGHGDGGGGVTREMLEYIGRAELMVGQPASRYSTASEFFEEIERRQPRLPKWHGDLYLELHRGTYTTHGRNKRSNRKAEVLYREADLWNAIAGPGMEQRQRTDVLGMLHEGWKLILLNQFHDIIPGTAITESYETSDKEYEQVFRLGKQALHAGLGSLVTAIHARHADVVHAEPSEEKDLHPAGCNDSYVVFNSLGWNRTAVVHLPFGTQAGTVTEEKEDVHEVAAGNEEGNKIGDGNENGNENVNVNERVNENVNENLNRTWSRNEQDPVGQELHPTRQWIVSDDQGNRLKADLENGGISVLIPDIPAFGYKTIRLQAVTKAAASEPECRAQQSLEQECSSESSPGQSFESGSDRTVVFASGAPSSLPLNLKPDSDRISDRTFSCTSDHKQGHAAAQPDLATDRTSSSTSEHTPGFAWDTAWYKVSFNDRGEMTRLFDKKASREVLKSGERGNRFYFFHDRPPLWDAWDIDPRYEEQSAGEAELLESRLLLAGATKDILHFRWRLQQSEITQDIIFYHHERRIDFKTHVSWRESHKLLKVGFPIDVVTEKATYEIPFGSLERPTHRNTSWDQARFEVCGHRFVDVSEHGYGVSLLNDCKYGYDVQGSTIRLSLLRAPTWPDKIADQGEHDFTYSLYPHEGDWRSAHTVRRAAELNTEAPVYALEHKEPPTASPVVSSTGSYLSYNGEHVVLDTIKSAEGGQGTILRLYESSGKRERITLQWPYPCEKVCLSNALEEMGESLAMQDGRIELSFAPYEIKTVLIR